MPAGLLLLPCWKDCWAFPDGRPPFRDGVYPRFSCSLDGPGSGIFLAGIQIAFLPGAVMKKPGCWEVSVCWIYP